VSRGSPDGGRLSFSLQVHLAERSGWYVLFRAVGMTLLFNLCGLQQLLDSVGEA